MIDGNFRETLEGLKGLQVGIFLIDNQYVEGTLLNVQLDYLIVEVKQNNFYFPIDQIKALRKNAKDSTLLQSSSQEVIHFEKRLFKDVLEDLRFHWVTINSFTKPIYAGILSIISDDYILLSDGKSQFFVPKFNISTVFNGHFENEENQTANNDQKDEGQSEANTQNDQSQSEETSQMNEEQSENSDQINDNPESTSNEVNQQISEESSMDSELIQTEELTNVNDESSFSEESSPELEETIITESKENRVKKANNRSKNKFQNAKIKKLQNNLLNLAVSMNQETMDKVTEVKTPLSFSKKSDFMNIFDSINPGAPLNGVRSKKKNKTKRLINNEEPNEKQWIDSTKDEGIYNLSIDTPERKMSLEEERKFLEVQYYSLMKHAEKMSHFEQQYSTLMNHAKKMYEQIKNRHV